VVVVVVVVVGGGGGDGSSNKSRSNTSLKRSSNGCHKSNEIHRFTSSGDDDDV